MAPVRKIIRIAAGCFFLLLGLIGTIIPILPQVPFLLIGALLLAPYVRIIRKLLAYLHRKYPQSRRITRWFEKYVAGPEPREPRQPAQFPPRSSPPDPRNPHSSSLE
jgi:uncharacterized membrane protein YbaN (DUF454 family)